MKQIQGNPMEQFQQLSTSLAKQFGGGVKELPEMQRGLLEWAEEQQLKLKGRTDT